MSHKTYKRSLFFLVGLFLINLVFSARTVQANGGFHAFKEVRAIVTDANFMVPAKAGMVITVQDGHGQRVMYKEGVDPDGIIFYREIPNRFGLIRIIINNFSQAWAEYDPLTISVSYRNPEDQTSYETTTVETTLSPGQDDMGPDEDFSLNMQLHVETDPENQES